MEKITWCLELKNGIELVEPNQNLANEYLNKAEESLLALSRMSGIKSWEIETSYYSMYFALYAIMCRVGIKCENHSCSIEFMRKYLKEHFRDKDADFMEESRKARIDAQYYTDRDVPDDTRKSMADKAPGFYIKCREAIISLKDSEIKSIRNNLERKINNIKK